MIRAVVLFFVFVAMRHGIDDVAAHGGGTSLPASRATEEGASRDRTPVPPHYIAPKPNTGSPSHDSRARREYSPGITPPPSPAARILEASPRTAGVDGAPRQHLHLRPVAGGVVEGSPFDLQDPAWLGRLSPPNRTL